MLYTTIQRPAATERVCPLLRLTIVSNRYVLAPTLPLCGTFTFVCPRMAHNLLTDFGADSAKSLIPARFREGTSSHPSPPRSTTLRVSPRCETNLVFVCLLSPFFFFAAGLLGKKNWLPSSCKVEASGKGLKIPFSVSYPSPGRFVFSLRCLSPAIREATLEHTIICTAEFPPANGDLRKVFFQREDTFFLHMAAGLDDHATSRFGTERLNRKILRSPGNVWQARSSTLAYL